MIIERSSVYGVFFKVFSIFFCLFCLLIGIIEPSFVIRWGDAKK